DHSYVIPASMVSGSILLLLADTLGRAFSGGSSVPVGAITALIGAPFFLYLIFSKKEGSNA
ncbi:MAG: iron chelate uptake ABC transporter family permease subunit, partial [Bacilli bacterium]|nr:iron chelate uptake ABC transporter family permease subunit [Bacilli bacterium]